MSGFVTLVGTEDVNRAASRISGAAEQMQRAASQFEHAEQLLGLRLESFVSGLSMELDRIESMIGQARSAGCPTCAARSEAEAKL